MEGIHQILKAYWGYPAFRPLQEEIITSVMKGKDTLALLPTGGGKSICFQVPALAQEGICLVVSPLIALMKDQVEQLNKRGVTAYAIHSGMSYRQIDVLLNNCIYGKVKFLYVSPERLKTEILQERAKEMNINLLAVDEAHCISQWGYDFRPAYLEINAFRELIPSVTCLALTATATPQVQTDIQEKLSFPTENIFQKSFARANLSYSCFREEQKDNRLLKILHNVAGTAIIYARSRNRTQQIAKFLLQRGIQASFYHAGLPPTERAQRQEMWISGKLRVIVATNAFGMGIDKGDVRIVVHYDLPDTLEAYYQEAGRAGRDEKKAYATVLFHQEDIERLKQYTEEAYPEVEFLRNVYQRLANYLNLAVGSGEMSVFNFELEPFARTYNLPLRSTYIAIKRLEDEGFIQLDEGSPRRSTLMFLVGSSTLYEFQVANAQADALIKMVLRVYGGSLFDNTLPIDEKSMAKRLNKPKSEIVNQLKWLHQQQIIEYAPSSHVPQLTLLQGRYAADRLPIAVKAYLNRKQQALKKAKSVVRYVTDEKQCRTLLLLRYFGEESNQRCGICDHCLAFKKAGKPVEAMPIKALAKFEGKPFTFHDLQKLYPKEKKETLSAFLRQWVVSGEVKKLDYGQFKLAE